MSREIWYVYVNFEQTGSKKRETIRLSKPTVMQACDLVKSIWKGDYNLEPHIPEDKKYMVFYDWNIRNISIYNTEQYVLD